MEITAEEREELGELYGHLLWFSKFAKKMPANSARFDAKDAADDVLYLMGWADGRLSVGECDHGRKCQDPALEEFEGYAAAG